MDKERTHLDIFFCAKRFFNLSRMIFRLPQIEKSFAADRGNGLKMVYNKCLFSALKGYGAQGMIWVFFSALKGYGAQGMIWVCGGRILQQTDFLQHFTVEDGLLLQFHRIGT